MQRQVEVICWNPDSKHLHEGGSTHRPCLKETPAWVQTTPVGSRLPSALTPLWKKLNKMAGEEEKWRSTAVPLGTKSQNVFGDETSSCRGLCWRGGSKEGRIRAPAAWLKARGTSPTSEGCKPAPHGETGRTGTAVLKESATCYHERQLLQKKGHILPAELCCGVTWSTLHCPLHPGKESVHQSGFQAWSPPENSFNCVHLDKQLYFRLLCQLPKNNINSHLADR